MKSQQVIAVLGAAVLAIAAGFISVSCEKKPIKPAGKETAQPEPTKIPPHEEGIRSIQDYNNPNTGFTDIEFYEIVGPWPGVRPVISYGTSPSGASTVRAYGATTGHEAFVYKDGTDHWIYYDGMVNSITYGGGSFPGTIHEIEIHPGTLDVYAIARTGLTGATQLYYIDITTWEATLVGNLNAGGTLTQGTLTFVPNGAGYRMVHTYDTATSPSTSVTMKYYTVSGATMTLTDTFNWPSSSTLPLPSGGSLNTTYGNGTFYIARDNGNLYTMPLPVTGSPLPGATLLVSSATFKNRYDFGYWSN